MLDIFHTLSEVAVAITGFSSLLIIFKGSTTPWKSQDYISIGFILAWSIGAIFLALLPILLMEFNVNIHLSARIGLISTIGYIVIVGSLLTQAQNSVAKREGKSASTKARSFMTLLILLVLLTSLLSIFNVLPGPTQAWYATAIISLLLIATANLGLFVVQSTQTS